MGKKAWKRATGRNAKNGVEEKIKQGRKTEHWETRVDLGLNGEIKNIIVVNKTTGSAAAVTNSNGEGIRGAKDDDSKVTASHGKPQKNDSLNVDEKPIELEYNGDGIELDSTAVVTKERDAKGNYVYRLHNAKTILGGQLVAMDFKIVGRDEQRVIYFINYFHQETNYRRVQLENKVEKVVTDSKVQQYPEESQNAIAGHQDKISKRQMAGWMKLFKIFPLVEATTLQVLFYVF